MKLFIFLPFCFLGWIVSGLLSPVFAQEKPGVPSRLPVIASVNLNRVSSQIGYQELAFLGAPAELKLRLREMAKEEKAAQSKILQVKDEGDMQKLQVELRVLGEKKRLFMQAFQTSSSGRDRQKNIKDFVHLKFSEKYPIIFNGGSDNPFVNVHNVISFRAETKDITEEVITALTSEISVE
jgi:Skp family chaperone for outer membrane proteins